MTEYNGWTNWETWQVPLWIDNEEPLYHEKIRFLRRTAIIDARNVEAFCRDIFPDGTPDMDSPADMNKVDWDEIAEDWQIEADEEDENVQALLTEWRDAEDAA